MINTILAAAAGILLSLNTSDGIYHTGDTVKVFADNGHEISLVHERICGEGPDNVRFDYEDTCIGWVVNPEQFSQGLPCPKDFMKFWKSELRKMRRLPMNPVLREVEVKGEDAKDYICYEITLDCVDDTPVRGYMAMPRAAARKSLPIVVFMHAAGVAGNWCRSHADEAVRMAKWGNGAIAVDFNAFGMLNDQPQSYYDELENGPLKGYSTRGSKDRESFFFKNMYLRTVRAVDFAVKQPQWDGKRILAYGQSQGGAQAFALAGLDKRITAVVGIVPGGCNLSKGRYASWPFVEGSFESEELAHSILPYFDCCNFWKQTKAKIWVEIGLMDATCRPEAIWSAINVCPSKDITIVPSPWRYHNEPDKRYHRAWWDNIATKRYEFVNEYLK